MPISHSHLSIHPFVKIAISIPHLYIAIFTSRSVNSHSSLLYLHISISTSPAWLPHLSILILTFPLSTTISSSNVDLHQIPIHLHSSSHPFPKIGRTQPPDLPLEAKIDNFINMWKQNHYAIDDGSRQRNSAQHNRQCQQHSDKESILDNTTTQQTKLPKPETWRTLKHEAQKRYRSTIPSNEKSEKTSHFPRTFCRTTNRSSFMSCPSTKKPAPPLPWWVIIYAEFHTAFRNLPCPTTSK